MSLKLYTDGHIAHAIVTQLRQKGLDVVRCEDVGLKDAADEEHLEYATREERTIVSHDADFIRLHNERHEQGKKHFSVIRIKSDNMGNIGAIVSELYFLHEAIEGGAATLEDEVYNKVSYI